MQDYYAILEVPATASATEIKKSYRRLARLHHPDLNQSGRDTQIKRLNEAYEVLRDPQKRAVYDAQRRELQKQAEALAAFKSQQQVKREPEMTWVEGMIGFVRELKKGMREE